MTSKPASPDEYFICAGKIMQNCALMDLCMAKALEALIGCSQEMAQAIFFTFDSLNQRQTLLTRVAKLGGVTADIESIRLLTAAASKANNQRQQFAHATISFEATDVTSKMTKINPKSGHAEQPTKDSLATALKHCGEAVNACLEATETLCGRHKLPFEVSDG